MCWMGWEQSKEPFSDEIISYIKNINIKEDLNRISNNIKIRQICLKNFRISNTVLKISINYGLTLYDIGMLIYRPEFDEVPSQLEIIVEKVNKITKLFRNGKSVLYRP